MFAKIGKQIHILNLLLIFIWVGGLQVHHSKIYGAGGWLVMLEATTMTPPHPFPPEGCRARPNIWIYG